MIIDNLSDGDYEDFTTVTYSQIHTTQLCKEACEQTTYFLLDEVLSINPINVYEPYLIVNIKISIESGYGWKSKLVEYRLQNQYTLHCINLNETILKKMVFKNE